MSTKIAHQGHVVKEKYERSDLFRRQDNKYTFYDLWDEFYNRRDRKQRILGWVMMILVAVESVFLFIQAGRGFSTKSAEDIDLAAFVILLVINILWIFYGWFVLRDLPVVVSGFLYSVGAILVLVTAILYGSGETV